MTVLLVQKSPGAGPGRRVNWMASHPQLILVCLFVLFFVFFCFVLLFFLFCFVFFFFLLGPRD